MGTSSLGARHRASRPWHPLRMLGTASAVAAAVVGAVFASGGTYATWNDEAVVTSTTVTSATLAIEASESFDDVAWTNLLVGESVRQPFTVTNTGDVAVALSGTATTGSAGFEIRLASGACSSTALPGASATVSATALSTLAAGATTTACAEVTLTAAASPGDAVNFTITVIGTQAP